jgi:hypothetical protein
MIQNADFAILDWTATNRFKLQRRPFPAAELPGGQVSL